MYIDDVEGIVFRPPSEADSLIIRATVGCSHNACSFCAMYKDVAFRVRPMSEIRTAVEKASLFFKDARRVFLADGNVLTLETHQLLEILTLLRDTFPRLTRVGAYAGPKDILRKTPEELKILQAHGLKILYLGIESGDAQILREIAKGVTPEEMITAGTRIMDAGIKLSATMILGLGGKERTVQHALQTAAVINNIQPTMIGALTLMVYPNTPLAHQIKLGRLTPLTTREIFEEQYRFIEAIQVENPCIFRSNHASNYLALAGTLPKDKTRLLDELRQALLSRTVPNEWTFRE